MGSGNGSVHGENAEESVGLLDGGEEKLTKEEIALKEKIEAFGWTVEQDDEQESYTIRPPVRHVSCQDSYLVVPDKLTRLNISNVKNIARSEFTEMAQFGLAQDALDQANRYVLCCLLERDLEKFDEMNVTLDDVGEDYVTFIVPNNVAAVAEANSTRLTNALKRELLAMDAEGVII